MKNKWIAALALAGLLLTTGAYAESTPAETAAALGFCNVFHFSRSFKRHFGVTPAEYLRRRRERLSPF